MDLSKIDPNLVAGIGTLLGTLVTWLVGKARGQQQRDLGELLDEAITAEVLDALEDNETVATIENRLTDAALKLGGKLGLKIPEPTVRFAVQWGVVEFRKKLKEREANQKAARELPAKLDDLATQAAKVVEAFRGLTPDKPIDTISEARAAGVELLELGPDGKLRPAK
jgi:hypothetical protein